MHEYKLLLPLTDNSGADNTAARAEVLASALRYAGGYTLGAPGIGAWRNPDTGEVFNDAVCPLYVAAESADIPRQLACYAAHTLAQICIYLAHPGGEVEFVGAPVVVSP